MDRWRPRQKQIDYFGLGVWTALMSRYHAMECTSVSDKYFYEELLLAAGPEVSYEWLSLHSKRTSHSLKDLNKKHQQSKLPSPVFRLENAGTKNKANCVERIEHLSSSSSTSVYSTNDFTWNEGRDCPSVAHSSEEESITCKGDDRITTSCAETPCQLLHVQPHPSQLQPSQLQHSASAPELQHLNTRLNKQVVHLSRSCNAANMGLLFTDAAHTLLE
jgi:hypothetical protein